MQRIETVAELRELVDAWREAGDSIALVPTMGNLHKGHMSLVQLAVEQAEHVIVSVFVNPTQFGPTEDFANYPRTLDMDARRLARANVDVLFEPSVEEMYPDGTDSTVQVIVPELSDELCGAERPGHFIGVTSVVCRLFNICMPHIAVFGQKDYQQLVILRRMARQLHISTQLVAGATERAESGLALSSRNSFLSDDDQGRAAALYRVLCELRVELESGRQDFAALAAEGVAQMAEAGLEVEYVAVRRARDLGRAGPENLRLVVLAAVRCAGVRLIDNVLVTLKP